MGRKLGFTSLFTSSSSWAWSSCKQHPRTDSFRAVVDNSVYFDSTDYSFTHSSSEESLSTSDNDDPEGLIRGLVRSDRLFFEPGSGTRSILGSSGQSPFKKSVAVAVESRDPYLDFKKSMEEMVAAHGSSWEYLEELLVWYLKMNGKGTHGYIVGAFVDLLVGIAASDDVLRYSSSSCCGSSSLSLSTSRNCNEIEEVEEESGSC